MTAFTVGSSALLSGGEPEQVRTTTATAELFTVLRGRPLFGRTFAEGDDVPGAPPVAVISHGLWQRRFGADRAAVGTIVTIDDRPTTIVGVMPPGFGRGNQDTDLWLPLTIDRAQPNRGGRGLSVFGRLAENVTLDRARSEMVAIAQRLGQAYPESNAGWSVTLIPLEEAAVGTTVRRALLLLLGAVVFVLLIACVNVANLLSARGVVRQREMAMRTALGANRWRLARQLLTESLALAAAGGLLGLFVAVWGTRVLLAIAPPDLPRLFEVSVDGRVLAASLGATLAAALLFGLVPALQTMTVRPDDTLKDSARGSTGDRGRRRLSQLFVVAETGIAVVLLVGAGLLVRSFVKLSSQPIGFNPEQAITFMLRLPEARYARHRGGLGVQSHRARSPPRTARRRRRGRHPCPPLLRHGQRASIRPRGRVDLRRSCAERRIPYRHARILRGDGNPAHPRPRIQRERTSQASRAPRSSASLLRNGISAVRDPIGLANKTGRRRRRRALAGHRRRGG